MSSKQANTAPCAPAPATRARHIHEKNTKINRQFFAVARSYFINRNFVLLQETRCRARRCFCLGDQQRIYTCRKTPASLYHATLSALQNHSNLIIIVSDSASKNCVSCRMTSEAHSRISPKRLPDEKDIEEPMRKSAINH